jgi:hypothetical protein
MKKIILAASVMILSLKSFSQKFNGVLIDGNVKSFVDSLSKKFNYRLLNFTDSGANIISTENDTLIVKCNKDSIVCSVLTKIYSDDLDQNYDMLKSILNSIYTKPIEYLDYILFDVRYLNLKITVKNNSKYIELLYENTLNL